MTGAIKVLVVDDSPTMRQIVTRILEDDPDIDVVGSAKSAHQARELIKILNPDVMTLDVEMPEMDGLSFLERVMRLRPMPVVMVSSMTAKGTDTTIEALALGALLDGIPEQLVLGIGVAAGEGVSVGLLVAIFVSNLPEAIGGSADLIDAGHARRTVARLWVAVAAICTAAAID